MYFQGRLPRSVNMYWRRFRVADIPIAEEHFKAWILDRWREKDDLLDFFAGNQHFPANISPANHGDRLDKDTDWIDTEVKPLQWFTWMQIFIPVTALTTIVVVVTKLVHVLLW